MELADFVTKFEGFRSEAYQDSARIWTVGYGSTFNPLDKTQVKKGDRISKNTAKSWLDTELASVQSQVKSLVKVLINANQLNALTSFTYNVGIGNLKKSTLLKLLNAGAPNSQVAAEFIKWNKAGGNVLKGLTLRRQAERDLFLS